MSTRFQLKSDAWATIPCAFCVNNQWYQSNAKLVREIRTYCGMDWTNEKIIEYVRNNPKVYEFRTVGKIIQFKQRGTAWVKL